jgi:hypothetical protein
MVHNLNRRIREDLARKERSGDRSSSDVDGVSAAEKVTQIGEAVDVEPSKPPQLPDLIDDIVDDDRTTIDVLPPEVLRALLEEDEAHASRPEPRTVPYGEVAEPRTVPYGEVEPAAEPRTVAYGRLSIARPPADVVPIASRRPPEVASVIADLDADEPMTVMQRRPAAAPRAAATAPVAPAPVAPAPVAPAPALAAPAAPAADAPPWRVTAQADELHFAAERRSRIVIGSMASCDWVLDHPAVRAVHCELVYDDGWFLSARAPVRFLELDVQGWTPVASGDVIGIGGAALRLEFARLDDATAAADAPAAAALPAVAAPVPEPVMASAPSAPVAVPAKSAAEDAVFRLPEAEDATAARAPSSSPSSSKRAVLGLLVLAALGGLYFTQRAGRGAPTRTPAAAVAQTEAKALAAAAPVAPRPVVTIAEPALATKAAGGVSALLDGNYRAALVAYRRVAAEGGGEAADIFVRALESRLAAPCRRAGRPIKECIP